MASITGVVDEKTKEVYDILDNEDGTYDVIQKNTDKSYKASMVSCSCAGFKYRHSCKHHKWIMDKEKSLYKHEYSYEVARQIYNNFLQDFKSEVTLDESIVKLGVGGSFARESETVRDIDMVIATDKEPLIEDILKITTKVFSKVIVTSKFLIRGIYTVPSCDPEHSGKEIQVDIHICPLTGYEAYKLYLTGSYWFKMAMRKKAGKERYKLTEQGLFKYNEVKKEHTIFITNDEKEIFQKIGMEYFPLNKREWDENIFKENKKILDF